MQNKTKQEKFITKFSRIYTPIVIALAFFFALVPPLIIGLFSINGESISSYSLWQNWINVGCSFLVISCPCSLVLSVPLTYFVAIGVSSKYKAIVKGTVYLEYLNSLSTIWSAARDEINILIFLGLKLSLEVHIALGPEICSAS